MKFGYVDTRVGTPHKVMGSIELFATRVMPQFKKARAGARSSG